MARKKESPIMNDEIKMKETKMNKNNFDLILNKLSKMKVKKKVKKNSVKK